jgi:hypothetical protein
MAVLHPRYLNRFDAENSSLPIIGKLVIAPTLDQLTLRHGHSGF